MGAVFEKIVTYYDIRIIRLSLEALLSRMGKRRCFPDIEQDRDIQTREDKLGFCEKRVTEPVSAASIQSGLQPMSNSLQLPERFEPTPENPENHTSQEPLTLPGFPRQLPSTFNLS
ncbi:hypothetical protein D5086_015970 [Populus alba]|uniref:Uncharacterized protein n=1 Tax=Populus alba TaxID=43335 RepID=A0ACC4BSQ0_POPAL